jgi:hypothetical protein
MFLQIDISEFDNTFLSEFLLQNFASFSTERSIFGTSIQLFLTAGVNPTTSDFTTTYNASIVVCNVDM